MTIEAFEDYLDQLGYDFDVDEDNDAIDIVVETSAEDELTITLVQARAAYTLFVSPLIDIGDEPDLGALHSRLLELNDTCRYVKFSLDADGDIKIAAEGFSRLDAYGQFRRRLEAIIGAVDDFGDELAKLADGSLL